MLTSILDIVLIFFKLMGQIPDLLDKYQKYKQDSNYAGTVAKLDAALNDYVKAKHEKNIQAMLNASHAVASGGPK